MNERTSYVTWMFGFLTGGAAGASVALLLAPKSGPVIRRLARRKLRHGTDSARSLKDRVLLRGDEIRQRVAHRVERAASALAGDGRCTARGKGAEPVSAHGAARMAEWEVESGGEA